jgi:hypothetical protein
VSKKLARLEALVADLETAAGFNPDIEVVRQADDGSWPEPQTDARVVVERVRFKPSLLDGMQQKIDELAKATQHERDVFEYTRRNIPRG